MYYFILCKYSTCETIEDQALLAAAALMACGTVGFCLPSVTGESSWCLLALLSCVATLTLFFYCKDSLNCLVSVLNLARLLEWLSNRFLK